VRVKRKRTTIFLYMETTDTVHDLRARINHITKVPTTDVKFFIDKEGEIALDENKTLADQKVRRCRAISGAMGHWHGSARGGGCLLLASESRALRCLLARAARRVARAAAVVASFPARPRRPAKHASARCSSRADLVRRRAVHDLPEGGLGGVGGH
jgi:hypothetical protein